MAQMTTTRRALLDRFLQDPVGTMEQAMEADLRRTLASVARRRAAAEAFDLVPVPAGRRLLVRIGPGWVSGCKFADGPGFEAKALKMTRDRSQALGLDPMAARAIGRQYAADGHPVVLETR